MGASSSKDVQEVIPEEILDEYIKLTYLQRSEILRLFNVFSRLNVNDDEKFDMERRYDMNLITQLFPQLKFNPFRDRICKVFSSLKDDCFSFEDMLDLCSIMSCNCPEKVKATWAFYIYDLNDDGFISKEDITIAIRRLTRTDRRLSKQEINHISSVLLEAIDLQGNGKISLLEFQHAVGKMPDFISSFMFRI